MNCSKCGYQYDDSSNFCPMCGAPKAQVVQPEQPEYHQPEQPVQPQYEQQAYQQPQQPTYQQPQQPTYQQPQPQSYQQPQTGGNARGKATTALVCGILAIAIPFAGIALGIVALILGNSARKEADGGEKGMATAGFIMGIIGLVIWSIVTLVAIVTAATFGMVNTYSTYDFYDSFWS